MYAAQLLNIITERCIVFVNSNSSVEASHDICMKCVAVAGKHPVFELGAADMVVRRLDDLPLVDLKNLADLDSPEFHPLEPELELEPEEDAEADKFTVVVVQDIWYIYPILIAVLFYACKSESLYWGTFSLRLCWCPRVDGDAHKHFVC